MKQSALLYKGDMFKFYELLERIRKRPGMYLGNSSIIRLKSYLDGYLSAREDLGCEKTQEELQFSRFQDWIQNRFSVKSSQSWARIILFYSSDEVEALSVFFDLLDGYKSTFEPESLVEQRHGLDSKENAI